jgi:hypothetical protein
VFTEPLLRNGLHNPVVPPLLGADDIENTASSIVACWTVFRAVAWQRVDQICYNIYALYFCTVLLDTFKLRFSLF